MYILPWKFTLSLIYISSPSQPNACLNFSNQKVSNMCRYDFSPIRLIDWLDRILRRIANISAIWRRLLLINGDHLWSFPGGPHKPTLRRNPEKRSFVCKGGCFPWHGAPFYVPSDGHKIIYIFIYITLDDKYSYWICIMVKFYILW